MLDNPILLVRDKESLATRALCLGIFLYRLTLEVHESKRPGSGAAAENEKLLAWANDNHLLTSATEQEMMYLQRPFGSWPASDFPRLIWLAERLGTLLWILSYLKEMPAVDVSLGMELNSLLNFIPLLDDPTHLLEEASLRPIDEIASLDDLLTTYAFTLSIKPKDLSKPTEDGTMRDTLRREAEAVLATGMVQQLIDHQLPAFKKGLGAISRSERGFLHLLLEQ